MPNHLSREATLPLSDDASLLSVPETVSLSLGASSCRPSTGVRTMDPDGPPNTTMLLLSGASSASSGAAAPAWTVCTIGLGVTLLASVEKDWRASYNDV